MITFSFELKIIIFNIISILFLFRYYSLFLIQIISSKLKLNMKKTDYKIVMKKNHTSVRNVKYSSCDRKNWIKTWKKYAKQEPGICTYLDCSKKATLGGHLWTNFQKSKKYYFIAPICAKCNSSSIKKKKFHEAKKGTKFLKIPKNPCTCKKKEKVSSTSNKKNNSIVTTKSPKMNVDHNDDYDDKEEDNRKSDPHFVPKNNDTIKASIIECHHQCHNCIELKKNLSFQEKVKFLSMLNKNSNSTAITSFQIDFDDDNYKSVGDIETNHARSMFCPIL